jgi:hypothetical protein
MLIMEYAGYMSVKVQFESNGYSLFCIQDERNVCNNGDSEVQLDLVGCLFFAHLYISASHKMIN